jgi:acyl-CoA synthetase (AMP-forming)/AMP-acid ligase II
VLAERLGRLAGTGDRVALVAPNAPALVIGLQAAWRIGAVAVPLSARLREYELTRVLADAEPAAIVSIESHGGYAFAPALSGAAPALIVDPWGDVVDELEGPPSRGEPLPAEVAAVLYTSGTTGEPKGVLMTHASVDASARSLGERLELTRDDVTALVAPGTHAFGFGCLLAALAAESCTVLVDAGVSLEPLRAAVAARSPSVLHGSPTLFGRLLDGAPELLAGLRSGFVAGAACPPPLLERLDAAGPTILNLFGMTELGPAIACALDDPPERRHTTVGRPLPGFEVRVAGEELQLRGPYVTPGYLNRPEETARAFDDGWFRTGDLGSIDEDGYVRIAGREKDVVNVGGFNVFPAEVEAFLLTHPDVAQAVVVGVPHSRMGEALAAFVVVRRGAQLEPGALIRFARPRIAGYKLPYAITVVDELPLLPSGKPDRAALAEVAA